MLKGLLVNNNSKNLTIIFQSAGRISKDLFERILNGSASYEEVKSAHEKYTWFKFSNYKYSDYYFVEDYFSQSYGWYMFDGGKSIINEFNEELSRFIKDRGYKNVTTYGSSKGGTAALLYGLINPNINNVFSLVPQVYTIKYINLKLSKYKRLFFPKDNPENEEYFDKIFFNEEIYSDKVISDTNIYIYTGINDEQFEDLLPLHQLLDKKVCNNNIIINSSMKGHNNIVMDNVPFINSALKIITLNQVMKGPRLKRVNSNVLLLKDK
ncbi:hypothetical protein [Staphylococcus debuckii]|uniref:hypothetical protein n=1 Tax=Staphylococcus debuckii TaxID=2044912 RepID=UPI000F436142|nr:hypothetical protein [Staphylococcus debuckii]AYU54380.1 hypothetical protein CNQ82_02595 [Staphylococcus debuckii]